MRLAHTRLGRPDRCGQPCWVFKHITGRVKSLSAVQLLYDELHPHSCLENHFARYGYLGTVCVNELVSFCMFVNNGNSFHNIR